MRLDHGRASGAGAYRAFALVPLERWFRSAVRSEASERESDRCGTRTRSLCSRDLVCSPKIF